VRHKRHDIEKFTKEELINYKRRNFTEEEKTQKRKIFKPTKDKKQHKIFYTKEKAKADFYKRGTEKRNAKRKDRRTRRESP